MEPARLCSWQTAKGLQLTSPLGWTMQSEGFFQWLAWVGGSSYDSTGHSVFYYPCAVAWLWSRERKSLGFIEDNQPKVRRVKQNWLKVEAAWKWGKGRTTEDSKSRLKDGNRMHLRGKVYLNPKRYRAPGRCKNKPSLFSLQPFYSSGGLSSCYPVWAGWFVYLILRSLSWGPWESSCW